MAAAFAGYSPPEPADVADLECEVEAQLKAPDAPRLKLLGYGSFSIAVAHPKASPLWALKRLPPNEAARVRRHQAHIERYIDLLERAGVKVVPTSLHVTPAAAGGQALYIAQPVLPTETLAPIALRVRAPSDTDEVLVGVIAAIRRGISPRLGIDGNFGNWAWIDGAPWYFDLSTPLTRGAAGKPELDVSLMLRPYLIFARPYLRWFVAPKLLAQYHDFRLTVREAIGMLQMEGLADWIAPAVAAANRLLEQPITVEETKSAFGEERNLDLLAYRMRLAQRRLVELFGRTYQFLTPPPSVREKPATEAA